MSAALYRKVELISSKNKLMTGAETDLELRTEYTAYRIRVTLANGEPPFTLTKRYSDFRRFYKNFINSHGRLPDYRLPRKHMFTSMTEAVIERRKVKLQRLMDLVLQQRPISKHLVQFLTRVSSVCIARVDVSPTIGTYYWVEVTLLTGTTYQVQKRYTDFYDMYDRYTAAYGALSGYTFPRKHLFKKETEASIANRRAGLELLVKKMAKQAQMTWDFWIFLKIREHETGMIPIGSVVAEGGRARPSATAARSGGGASAAADAMKKQRQRRLSTQGRNLLATAAGGSALPPGAPPPGAPPRGAPPRGAPPPGCGRFPPAKMPPPAGPPPPRGAPADNPPPGREKNLERSRKFAAKLSARRAEKEAAAAAP